MDYWKAYCDLGKYYKQHYAVNHYKEFVNIDNLVKIHTNTIEGNWVSVKKDVPFRCRTLSRIRTYLLYFILKRSNNETMLITLLNYSLEHINE